MPKPTAIIFDLDGTLADSIHCIVETVHAVERLMHLPTSNNEAIEAMIGRPLSAIFTEVHQLKEPMLQQAIDLYKTHYVPMTAAHERLFDGSLEILATLRAQGYKLAIATGKDQHGAENACERLGLTPYFDTIHGILPGTPGKPDPAILHRVMAALQVTPDECIMIGDTTHDMGWLVLQVFKQSG